MKKLVLIIFVLFAFIEVSFADNDNKVKLVSFQFYQTDKKGNHISDFIIERNDRFNFYTVTIITKDLRSAFVLNEIQFNSLIDKLYKIGELKKQVVEESLDEDDVNKIWSLYFYISAENSMFFKREGKIAHRKAVIDGPNCDEKILLTRIDNLTEYLCDLAEEFMKKYDNTVLVTFYDSQGPNGLAGILRDRNGKVVDQTRDVAYTLTVDGPKVYTYAYGHIDVLDVTNPEQIIKETSDVIEFVDYVEPDEHFFVTDAAPPCYFVALSDGRSVSTEDEYKLKKNLIRKRYDVNHLYKVFSVLEEHSNYHNVIRELEP